MRMMAELLKRGRYADEIMPMLAKEAAAAFAHTGRNDPCPCGSGKKFKKCHGDTREEGLKSQKVQGLKSEKVERTGAQTP
jgi:uncharacterized protein